MLLPLKKKLILGSEYDDALRNRVMECLTHLGAKVTARQFGLGGSQIIETTKLVVGRDLLVLEAETYVGLSLSGSVRLVDRVAAMLADNAEPAPQ